MISKYKQAISFFAALTVILAAGTTYYIGKSNRLEAEILRSNERALSQLSESLSTMDSALQKARFAASDKTLSYLSAQIWREATAAKAALSTLPQNSQPLEGIEKFVSQSGDYAYSVLRTVSGGGELQDDVYSAITSLAKTGNSLCEGVGRIKRGLNFEAGTYNASTLSKGFSDVEQELPEYATLVYDGPFSEHMSKRTPALTENLVDVTEEQAIQNLSWMLNLPKTAITGSGSIDSTLPCYRFSLSDGSSAEITKKGGLFALYSNPRSVSQLKLSARQAIEKAQAFLSDKGYVNMRSTYYMTYENVITINFAYAQNGITVYSDLIKINVALDDGSIVGFEARGYIMSHKSRTLPHPAIEEKQALDKLNSSLTVSRTNIALIPTSGGSEVLCYEFVCNSSDGINVLIYVNAQTGMEENILLLIEDESGTLTI